MKQRKMSVIQAIKKVQNQTIEQRDQSILELDDNTDDLVDESGKTIRWRRIVEIDQKEAVYKRTFCGTRGERILTELEEEAALSQFNDELFEKLKAR